MSLAAVAQDDFSRAYLNQIELGRARPSSKILSVIAERLQRPVEYFLQDPNGSPAAHEFMLAEAGMRLRRGDAVQAREAMAALLARPQLQPQIRARAQLLLAEAQLKLHQVAEAIEVLQSAIRACEASGWRALAVELFDRMGLAHYELRHPHEAGRWWDRALSAYEDAELTDPLLKARILGHRANLQYVGGQPREAIASYQAAIGAAEHVLDMQALGGIYEGLALSFHRAGDLTLALEYAQRSLKLFDTLRDVRMSARLRNNMAEILLSRGRPEEAETLYLEGADQLRRVSDKDLLPHLLAGSAEAALDRGDRELATSRIAAAVEATADSTDPLARLVTERIFGRIAHAGGKTLEARKHFDLALECAEKVGSPMEISRVAFDYAQVLEEQDDVAQAVVRYRQAYQARQAAGAS